MSLVEVPSWGAEPSRVTFGFSPFGSSPRRRGIWKKYNREVVLVMPSPRHKYRATYARIMPGRIQMQKRYISHSWVSQKGNCRGLVCASCISSQTPYLVTLLLTMLFPLTCLWYVAPIGRFFLEVRGWFLCKVIAYLSKTMINHRQPQSAYFDIGKKSIRRAPPQ